MPELTKVVFEVADVAAEERLVRTYVGPAVRRLADREDARWPFFNRYGQDPAVDDGQVVLGVFGDPEAVVADERPRWTDLADDGPLLDWQVDATGVRPADLDDGRRLRYRMRAAASRMSLAFLEEFDDVPDARDALDDGEQPLGFGVCLHHVMNQLGYQADGGEEEMDVLFRGLVGRLYGMAVAPGYGADAAESKVDELTDELQSLPEALRRMEDEHGA